MLINIPKPN